MTTQNILISDTDVTPVPASLEGENLPSERTKQVNPFLKSSLNKAFALGGLLLTLGGGLAGVSGAQLNPPQGSGQTGTPATLSSFRDKRDARVPAALNGAKAEEIFRKFGVERYFSNKSNWKPYTEEYRLKNLKNGETPITWNEVEKLKFYTTVMVYNSSKARHVAGRSTTKTGEVLHEELNDFLKKNGYENISKDMRGILEIRASSAWTVRNTQYKFRALTAIKSVNPQLLMDQSEPPAICTDAAVIARDIGRAMAGFSGSGNKLYFVEGSRVFASEPNTDRNKGLGHAWFGGILESGMRMQSDPTPPFSEGKLQMDWSKPWKTYKDCPTDEVGCEINLATFSADNHTKGWN